MANRTAVSEAWALHDPSYRDHAKVYLCFGLRALDTLPFHISDRHGHYGEFDADRDFDSRQDLRTFEQFAARGMFGEVVIRGDLPTQFIGAIWVHHQRYDYLMEALRTAQVAHVYGRPVSDLIQVAR